MKIGVGISTYGRRDAFDQSFRAVVENSREDTVIVVADDGSPEGSPDVSGGSGVVLLSNPNGGIARNKNRLLANLFFVQGVDVAILLEDDVRPTVKDWEDPWGLVGLINGAGFWSIPGLGSWKKNTYMSVGDACTAQLLVVSREAFDRVGYIDPRFTGYGFEHCEWQRRLAVEGFGGIHRENKTTYLSYDFRNLENIHADTTGSQEKIDEMWPVFVACQNDTGWKNAWVDDDDRDNFFSESGIDLPVNA